MDALLQFRDVLKQIREAAGAPTNVMGNSSTIHGTGDIDADEKPLRLLRRKHVLIRKS
jgi:hypothetical protein